ncbi:MAG: DUF418 domain-containing protein [Candidatus Electrothrix sp. YB6]
MKQAAAQPITEKERIQSIDVLRGFAVLCILAINIRALSGPWVAYFNPAAYGDLSGINYLIWLVTDLFFYHKFLITFSILFGAGVILFTERLESRDKPVFKIYYLRNSILLLMGIAHYILIWDGDILHWYGLCAFFLYWLRKLPSRYLLIAGAVIFSFQFIIRTYYYFIVIEYPPKIFQEWMQYNWHSSQQTINEIINIYKSGWIEQINYRINDSLGYFIGHVVKKGEIFEPLGAMLIGMVLFKTSVINASKSKIFYKRLLVSSLIIGLPPTVISAYIMSHSNFDAVAGFFVAFQFNLFGSLFLSLAYISIIMLLCKNQKFTWLTTRLSSVGRMAFTNYIMQSLICTWIFYGFGLGLYGSAERWEQMIVVLIIWLLQIWSSSIWLKYFRSGPLEWLWRSLTYWKFQSIRRRRPDRS